MYGFGRHEFQLMLLRRMQDFHPALVTEALGEIGATRADLLAAHRRWQELLRSPRFAHDVRRFQIALGTSDSERSLPFGEAVLTAHRWALPRLWSERALWK